ncbi:hypothetical protein [Chitinophaga sp. CF418]|uniref:hypothetical protein n=1 Tax=Chitinophaga sp. CF418 TaxID=1855287 RepID=UPI000913D514|nr:hypothetical protein [Chitinophaga sp. CF418]SHN13682.1 hypothetical protein SAMN05216311_105408 [Chitinophaga sp. CF418]
MLLTDGKFYGNTVHRIELEHFNLTLTVIQYSASCYQTTASPYRQPDTNMFPGNRPIE